MQVRIMQTALILAILGWTLTATAKEAKTQTVTAANFARAESDMYFSNFVRDGGFGKFSHTRELASIDHQTVIRLNRDTLYSFGVFDLEASPVTVTLPDAGKRYMALQVISEDHYAPEVFYAPGKHIITKEQVGTRYVALAIRTFVDPNSAADLKTVHELQDAVKVEQKSVGTFVVPEWDAASRDKMRKALLSVVEAAGGIDSDRMFGSKEQVDPVQHLLGTAAGWGGNPRTAAMYTGAAPAQNDGKTAYALTVKNVPVDGFWSVSVYNKSGFFEKNPQNAYTVNNVTAKPNADGSVTIHFGGGDTTAVNYLPIMPGWNYLFRMYRPQQAVLDNSWKVPTAQQAN
ncbi:DUF1214 domain-containing protein [Pseudomonas sp. PAMC 25886]|nr:DUF1214 domain-containing protein [Pseudomonas sp. PAMC 25886]